MVEARRVNNRMMTIKLVVGVPTLNFISSCDAQASLGKENKKTFGMI